MGRWSLLPRRCFSAIRAASPLATITGRRAFSLANLALLLPPRPFEIAGFDAEIDAPVFQVYGLNGLEIDHYSRGC